MLGCLITITPLDTSRAARTTVRLCSVDDRAVTGLGGETWEPSITLAPSIGMQFWNGDFEQGVDPGQIAFAFNLHQTAKRYPSIASFIWMGAAIEVRVGKVGNSYVNWQVRFSGKITDYAGDEYPKMGVRAAVDVEPFRADVLTRTYAGTGDAEGGADLKGRLKPLALGRPRNVEPVLVDAVNIVYQFSGYGPIEGVEALYERASAFGAPIADYTTYAALVAATIRPGAWATCNALGMIRLGAPAAGVITGDIRGHVVGSSAPTGAGALVSLAASIAGLSADKLDTGRLGAFDAEGSTASDAMVTDQVSLLDFARRMILPCNWQVFISNLGVLTPIKPSLASAPLLTFDVQGRAVPQVKSAVEQSVSAPYYQTTMAAQRNWRQQSFDEIAYDAPLIDRGDYVATTIYRDGNIVSLPDGSRWLFISQTPRAGVLPGTDFTVWDTLTNALQASGIKYADGTTVEDLQPAQAGADVTGDNTSKDTNAVGGVDADDVLLSIASAHDAIDEIDTLTDGIIERADSIETRTETLETDVGDAVARIETVETVAASADEAAARIETILEVDVNGQSPRLNTVEEVAATAYDRTSGARWSKEAVAGDGRAQLTVYALDNDGNIQAGVDIIGDLTIRGDVFVDGTIYTSKLAANAAQSVQFTRLASTVTLTYGQQVQIIQLTFQKLFLESSIDLYANLRMKSGDDIVGQFKLINQNDGVVQDTWPIWMVGANDNFQVPIALNWIATGWVPGTYTLSIVYISQENDATTWAETGSILKIHEIKR